MTLRQFQITLSCRLRDARNADNMRDTFFDSCNVGTKEEVEYEKQRAELFAYRS